MEKPANPTDAARDAMTYRATRRRLHPACQARGRRALSCQQQGLAVKTIQTMRSNIAVTGVVRAVLLTLAVGACMSARADDSDVLAIGETKDSSIKFFDAKTGRLLERPAIAPGSGGLKGPMGILFDASRKEWLVVNQNVDTPFNGGGAAVRQGRIVRPRPGARDGSERTIRAARYRAGKK
jgi:hypothetical protein